MKIVPLELGQAGLDHMIDWYQGWDRLAGYAPAYLKRFNHCLAFVPEGTPMARAEEYKVGGLVKGSTPVFAKYLLSVFEKNPDYCLVVMDHNMSPDNPHLEREHNVFFYEDQLYDYLDHEDLTQESIEKKLYGAAFFRMGFVIEASIDKATAEKQFVSKAVFENLAANIRMIMLSAYDDESYLLAF